MLAGPYPLHPKVKHTRIDRQTGRKVSYRDSYTKENEKYRTIDETFAVDNLVFINTRMTSPSGGDLLKLRW